MRKRLLLVVLTTLPFLSFAQWGHVVGRSQLGLTASKTDMGLLVGSSYSSYITGQLAIEAGLSFESGRPHQTLYRKRGVDVNAKYAVLNMSDQLYIGLKAGGFFAYEKVSKFLTPKTSLFGYGAKGGAEVEYFVTPEASLSVFYSQGIGLKTLVGKSFYESGITVRFGLN